MERLNREYNYIDWVGRHNSDKLSSLRVNKLLLYSSHHKITFKEKKAEEVAMIKAHIGSLLYMYNSMERTSTTSAAPVTKYATTSDLTTCRGRT